MSRTQEKLTIKYGTWIELTNADVTKLSFQVVSGKVYIRRGDTQQPSSNSIGWHYGLREGERDISLDEISHTGGARVWAKGESYPNAQVIVDHA